MQERETGDMLLLLLLVMVGVTMVMVTIAMVVTTVLLVIQTVVTAEIEKMVRTGIKVLMVIMVMVREIMVMMMMMGAVILRTLVGCVCLKKLSRGNSPSVLTVGLTAHSRACSDGKQEHQHGVCIRWLRKRDTCLEDDFLITQACSGL